MPRRYAPVPALALLAVLLAACGGGGPIAPSPPVDVRSDPYAAFPPPPPLDPITAPVEPRPLTARITHREPTDGDVLLLLDRLTTAVERRSWGTVAQFLDEDAFRAQVVFLADNGHSPQRAAAEALSGALGLDMAENPLFPPGADRDARPFLGLDRLETMTVQEIAGDPATGGWRASGYVRLDDRATLPFTLIVARTAHGLRVLVPQG